MAKVQKELEEEKKKVKVVEKVEVKSIEDRKKSLVQLGKEKGYITLK